MCDLSIIHKYLKNISQECREVLYLMLEADPDLRPSAKDVLSC